MMVLEMVAAHPQPAPPPRRLHGEEIQGKGGRWFPSPDTNIFMRMNKWLSLLGEVEFQKVE